MRPSPKLGGGTVKIRTLTDHEHTKIPPPLYGISIPGTACKMTQKTFSTKKAFMQCHTLFLYSYPPRLILVNGSYELRYLPLGILRAQSSILVPATITPTTT
jgi:hypothetical protein